MPFTRQIFYISLILLVIPGYSFAASHLNLEDSVRIISGDDSNTVPADKLDDNLNGGHRDNPVSSPVPLAAADVKAGDQLTLDDCIRMILKENSGIAQARSDVLASDMALKSASKDLYPSLSAQYGYTRNPDAVPSVSLKDTYSYTFSVEQPIYEGKALITAKELGKLNFDFAKSGLRKTINDTIVQAYESYYDVLKRQKLKIEAEQAVIRLQSHLKDARAFYQAGLIPKNDLLTSEVELAQGRQDLLQAENNLALAEANLNILMKRDLAAPISVADSVESRKKTVTWDEALQQARKLRPEIRQSEIDVKQADKNITLARAPYLPALSLSASYKKAGDNPDVNSYSLGASEVKQAQATLKWRFWAWGQSQNKVAEARHKETKAREYQKQLIDAITIEVHKAFLDMQQAEGNIKVTRKAVEQSEENYRISEARYQARLSTSTEVLDALSLMTKARTNYYNAVYDYNIALAQLDWATGALVDRYVITAKK